MSVFEKLNIVEKVENDTEKGIPVKNTGEKSESSEVEQKSEVVTEPLPDKGINIAQVDKIKVSGAANLSVEEIYRKYNIKDGGVNTIFMLDKFINALPEKLPVDVKKDSVMSILEASDTDLNVLISDGEKRLDILRKYSQDYTKAAGIAVEQYKTEIDKLNKLVKDYEEQIYLRESMLNEQNNSIKKESDKIAAVIDFFGAN
jgi:hypothetical protein